MSHPAATDPSRAGGTDAVELLIEPEEKDLGEFSVRRVLPSPRQRMVGPFIFFDHMGPAEFPPGEGIQVRPHPHIGLATVTYLFDGQIVHRDSLGVVQPIRAGAVNLMTAGRGIVHSERAGDDLDVRSTLHGIQTWMALPDGKEEMEPDFAHYAAGELPDIDVDGVTVRVIMGEAQGRRSPVHCHSPTLYLECRIPGGGVWRLPGGWRELAIYVVSGALEVAGGAVAAGAMAVIRPGAAPQVTAASDAHVMVIGGDPVGHRHVWWNLVSSSRERIEEAKARWKAGRFAPVPGDSEFIPLPE
jgi:redox-sensitive bicupin YhaK (pirin superfamily)